MIILLFSVLFGVALVFRKENQVSGEACFSICCPRGNEAPKDHESKAPDIYLVVSGKPAPKTGLRFPHSPAPDASGAFFWPRTSGDYYVKTVKKIVFYVLSIVRPC